MSTPEPRPSVKLRPKVWKSADGWLPGLALFSKTRSIVAHLTPAEALALADEIVDRIEQLEIETETTEAAE